MMLTQELDDAGAHATYPTSFSSSFFAPKIAAYMTSVHFNLNVAAHSLSASFAK
jgi:hypothetical protein